MTVLDETALIHANDELTAKARQLSATKAAEASARHQLTQLQRELAAARQRDAIEYAKAKNRQAAADVRAKNEILHHKQSVANLASEMPATKEEVLTFSILMNKRLASGDSDGLHVRPWATVYKAVTAATSAERVTFEGMRCLLRSGLHVDEAEVSEERIRRVWRAIDVDLVGQVSAAVFGGFMRKGERAVCAAPLSAKERLAMSKKGQAQDVRSQKKLLKQRAAMQKSGEAAAGTEELAEASATLNRKMASMVEDPRERSWIKLYKQMDEEQTGVIQFNSLTSLIRQELNISSEEMSDRTLRRLWHALDKDGTGCVTAGDFGAFMRKGESAAQMSQLTWRERVLLDKKVQADQVRAKLNELGHGGSMTFMAGEKPATAEMELTLSAALNGRLAEMSADEERAFTWLKLWQAMDAQSVGKINFTQLSDGLREVMGLVVPQQLLRRVWLRMDPKRSGWISCGDFGKFMRLGETATREPATPWRERVHLARKAEADQVRQTLQSLSRANLRDEAPLEGVATQREVKACAECLNARIAELVPANTHGTWLKLFKHVDEAGAGRIGPAEFRGMLRDELELTAETISEDEVTRVWNALDKTATGFITTADFGKFMRLGESAARESSQSWREKGALARKAEADAVRAKLATPSHRALKQQMARESAASTEEIRALSSTINARISELVPVASDRSWFKIFKHIDECGSGNISYSELQRFLREELMLSVDLVSDLTLQRVWVALDKESSGYISYGMFGGFMRLGEAKAPRVSVLDVRRERAARLRASTAAEGVARTDEETVRLQHRLRKHEEEAERLLEELAHYGAGGDGASGQGGRGAHGESGASGGSIASLGCVSPLRESSVSNAEARRTLASSTSVDSRRKLGAYRVAPNGLDRSRTSVFSSTR